MHKPDEDLVSEFSSPFKNELLKTKIIIAFHCGTETKETCLFTKESKSLQM